MIGLLANPFMDSTVATPPEAVAQADASPHLQDASAVLFESSSNERRPETDHISEIFFYARKLMKEPVGFVLDEQAFMAEIEEAPLFLRQVG